MTRDQHHAQLARLLNTCESDAIVRRMRSHLNAKCRRVHGRCVRPTRAAVYRRRGPSTFRRRGTNAVVYRRHGTVQLGVTTVIA